MGDKMKLLEKMFKQYRGLPKEMYILFIGRMVNSMGSFVFPLLALILTQKIGMSSGQAGGFATLLAVCQVPCLMLGGKLADTIGRRRVIILFQILGAAAYISCGFMKPSIFMTYIIILASCFYAISQPAYDALNADLTTPENRQAAYSLLYMGFNLGFAIGPIIGGMLYKKYLTLVFIGDAATTLISLCLFVIFIKETMIKKEEVNVQKEQTLESHVEGSAISVLLQRPILLIFSLIMLAYSFAYSQWGFALPIQMGTILGQDGARIYGLMGGLNGIVVIAFTPLLTTITRRLNPIKTMAIGGALYALSFGLFGFIKALPLFFFGVFVMTIGEILIAINNGAFVANHTPASHRGRISSVLPIISGAGFAFGPMIMGTFMETHSIMSSWVVIASVAIIGTICMFGLEFMDNKSKAVEESN